MWGKSKMWSEKIIEDGKCGCEKLDPVTSVTQNLAQTSKQQLSSWHKECMINYKHKWTVLNCCRKRGALTGKKKMTYYAYRSNPLFFFCHQEGCCASSFSSPLSVSTSTALAVKNMSSECGERQQWQQGGVAKSLSSAKCLLGRGWSVFSFSWWYQSLFLYVIIYLHIMTIMLNKRT